MNAQIKYKEFNNDLHCFMLTLDDGRQVKIVFKFQAVRGGGYYPMIDNDLELTDEEAHEIREYIMSDKDIQHTVSQFD